MLKNALRRFARSLPALSLALAATAVAFAKGTPKEVIKDPTDKATQNTPLQFTVKDIDGKDVNLADYKGKVVLIVNVASKCGFTSQYKGLEALYEKYKDQGFVILGFPANNFGGQEPGSEEQIKQFCSAKYNVSFPLMGKVSVKGDDITPLYKHLTEGQTNGEFAGDIEWNFNKFLVDRNGAVIARFPSPTKPEDAKVTSAIEKALAAKPAK
jgi:glutathione peroxidase